MMRRMRWMAGVVAAVVGVGTAGCVGDDEPVATTATDALVDHAAQVAVDFVALTDRAFAEVAVPTELYDIATDEIASNVAADVHAYEDAGLRLEGASQLVDIAATTVELTSSDSGSAALEACLDTSGSQVVDVNDQPVVVDQVDRRLVTFDIRWDDGTGTVTGTAFPDSGSLSCVP